MTEPKPYYSYARYLQKVFGTKTYKIVVSSGLSCPTRDGTISEGGCAFCDVRGSSSYFGKKGRGLDIHRQIDSRIGRIRERFGAIKGLAYFQSYTNTYADVGELREMYTEALSHPEIHGLCIGTRPDCLPNSVIALLEEISRNHYVSLELGVQSFENPTLEWLTRGHDSACSIDAIRRLRTLAPSVHVCAHLIFGSPTDSPGTARRAAQILNSNGVHGAKLHQLMILENTELARRYRESPFECASIENYAQTVSEFLEHLSPEIYVERLYATATHPEECVAPAWSRERWKSHNFLRDFLAQRSTRQGAALT